MIIIPLVENKKPKNRELNSEKGLSLYIETNSKKIIFDLGQYDIFKKNSIKLGIFFDEVDKIIVSHGHYDHFGGYNFLTSFEREKSIFHKEACNNFKMGCILYKNIGNFKNRDGGVDGQKIEIFKNIYLINTKLKRPSLFCKIDGKRDYFEHEYHLVIMENRSLNIVTGCCHCGLHELIKKVKEDFPNIKINSISGGIHTRNIIFKSIYIVRGIFLLKSEKINVLNLGHCTGDLATWILGKFLKVNNLRVGEKINI